SLIACENDDWCYMRIKCRAANGKHYFRDKGQDDQNQVTFKAPGTQLYGREDYSGKDYWIEISELNTENKTFNILIETSTFFIRDIIVFPEPPATFRGENLRYTE
ncbi:MAG: hypothetical protein MI810_05640, partial [Flavobacteriales bacterium]|nr:hypothetical protein [Flavobacteriales bacterium]